MKSIVIALFLLSTFATPLLAQTWEWAGPFAVNPSVDVAVLSGSRAIFAAQGGKLYRYENGSRVAVISEHYTLDFMTVAHVGSALAFAGGSYDSNISESNLWRSNDGGSSWLSIAPIDGTVRDVYFTDSLNGYALTASELFTTTDGGVAWASVSLSPAVADGDLRTLLARSDGLLLLANSTGLYRNASGTWEEEVTYAESATLELKFAGNTAVLLADGDFYVANDGALDAWNAQVNWPSATTMGWANDQQGYLASGNQLWRTANAGINWAQYGPSQTPEGNNLSIGQLAVSTDSVAFGISSTDSTIWRSTDALTVGRTDYNDVVRGVFPNPFSNQVTIELAGDAPLTRAVLMNAQGQVVWSQALSAQQQRLQLDLPNVTAGVYLLRLQGDGISSTQRLVKR